MASSYGVRGNRYVEVLAGHCNLRVTRRDQAKVCLPRHGLECVLFLFIILFYYAIMVVPISPPLRPSTQQLQLLRPSPQLCAWPWVMHISPLGTPFPILYFTFSWLFFNYLLVVLNPVTYLPITPHPALIWQTFS